MGTRRRNNFTEDMLCMLAGLLLAFMFIALMLGDGDKGLLDLF